MVKRALLVLIFGGMALGATLDVGSGAHFILASPGDLNGFVALVNQTIDFVQGLANVTGEVPPLSELRLGVGLSLGETLGGLGVRADLASWEAATEGTWSSAGSEYPVSLRLTAEYIAISAQAVFAVVPGVLAVGLSGGWGIANLDYASTFSVPDDWSIPFQPSAGAAVYRASGPVGQAFIRATFPIFPGLVVGIEAGLRLASLGVPTAGGTPMDLDADGRGETLDLSGMWLGACVGLSFGL